MLFLIYTTFITSLSVLIPITYAFINYRNLPRAFKIILAFIIFSAIMNAISNVQARVYHLPTLWIFHIYTPFEFAFLMAFFAEYYSKGIRYIMYGISAAFAVFCLLNTLFIQNANQMDGYARSLDAIILIACSMLFFANNNMDLDSKWADNSSNWIVAGILLYYASSLGMFIFFNMVTKPGIMTSIIWCASATILIIEYVLFAIGFYKCKPQQTTSMSR